MDVEENDVPATIGKNLSSSPETKNKENSIEILENNNSPSNF